ncbi:hypothetical protein KBF38_15940 [bacterium]|nr:hypothetical protein [bacterium]
MKIRLQSFTGGITLIDLAIIFAVVAVVGLPSFAAGVTAAVVVALFLLVALAVLLVVRGVGLMLRREHRQAES